jgi:hypothetical protein
MAMDSFTYKVIDIDHAKKEYTLKNIKTGRIRVVSKEDFDEPILKSV